MGYENLIDWTGSDASSDLMLQVFDSIRKTVRSGLNAKIGSAKNLQEWNTAGAVNIALVIEGGIFDPFPLHWFDKSDFVFFEKVKKEIQKEIKSAQAQKEWNSAQEKREHLVAFKRMATNVDHFAKMISKAQKT
ncbi:MAG TPA: hypothetical protein DCS07_09465 [Bdellovibrionales bacterium]|nr:MAG: hypothetical protein A2X97_03245 [Bdellovibrionales bacterium GWA1_52_35]OFZ40648.1 MAG: hypothetical protein A2070_06255 [Bdellovibrionales bacterium GWC1_52_8]HAR42839.1 hypothetical protein [Bdellovibrionales bacterium]HCM40369.1 hypothetical protein [Bdellovibrionales bacterium]